MNKLMSDRRLFIATVVSFQLWSLGFFKGIDVALALSGVVASVAAANAYEKKGSTDGKN